MPLIRVNAPRVVVFALATIVISLVGLGLLGGFTRKPKHRGVVVYDEQVIETDRQKAPKKHNHAVKKVASEQEILENKVETEMEPEPAHLDSEKHLRKHAFVATHEWQVVEEGQAVPPGLHIKMDMQTGKKMAKLMDKQEGVKLPSEIRRERDTRMKERAAAGDFARVTCHTSKGDIVIELRYDWAPLGASRLLTMMVDGYFMNNLIYRVPPRRANPLVQFGIAPDDSLRSLYEKYKVKDDAPWKNGDMERGYIAFAGNGKDSRTCHMFICVKKTGSLGKRLWETPVARVVEGMDIVDTFHPVGDMQPWGNGPDSGKIFRDKTFRSSFPGEYLTKNYPNIDYFLGCDASDL
eukprot:m.12740 g.12740  ORF g.12740 m.12740 type:complete len:351 (+) comp4730_c0_seq1:100-1152(+)